MHLDYETVKERLELAQYAGMLHRAYQLRRAGRLSPGGLAPLAEEEAGEGEEASMQQVQREVPFPCLSGVVRAFDRRRWPSLHFPPTLLMGQVFRDHDRLLPVWGECPPSRFASARR